MTDSVNEFEELDNSRGPLFRMIIRANLPGAIVERRRDRDVLLTIAVSSGEGPLQCSLTQLAELARCDPRTLKRSLARLTNAGLIVVDESGVRLMVEAIQALGER